MYMGVFFAGPGRSSIDIKLIPTMRTDAREKFSSNGCPGFELQRGVSEAVAVMTRTVREIDDVLTSAAQKGPAIGQQRPQNGVVCSSFRNRRWKTTSKQRRCTNIHCQTPAGQRALNVADGYTFVVVWTMLRNLTQWVASSFQSTDFPLAPGTDVRGYLIERTLHRGGMSWVYKARDMRGIAVVIKEFFPASSAYRSSDGSVRALPGKEDFYREAYRRFHEEGRCLGLFRGPTFTRARTFFRSANTAYIVMEIERGRPLSAYIRIDRQPISWETARPYMLDIRNGLLKMHKQNILHLDIHPANIFLNLNGRALLLDFGAARHSAEPVINTARFFTPGFSAPEIKQGVQWGTWSDIYSLGACLKAAGSLRNPRWPREIRVLTLECLREDIGARIHSFEDPRFDILLDKSIPTAQ